MTRLSVALSAAVIVALLALSHPSADLIDPLDPLVSWDYKAMLVPAEQGLQERHKPRDVTSRLLAWHVMVDDRGLKVEGGLLWFKYQAGGAQKWALADVYRHPNRSQEWSLSIVFDSPWEPIRVFDSAPTNQDVYEFGAKHWTFGAPPGSFKYLHAHVCVHAWREALGTEPTKRYPGEK